MGDAFPPSKPSHDHISRPALESSSLQTGQMCSHPTRPMHVSTEGLDSPINSGRRDHPLRAQVEHRQVAKTSAGESMGRCVQAEHVACLAQLLGLKVTCDQPSCRNTFCEKARLDYTCHM
jgi:hypothetical protein